MDKHISAWFGGQSGHWVGDGFPVRSLFSYASSGEQISPFLLLDYAGPYEFMPSSTRRGVGVHPHRGFETVTIVYDGAVEHRDSAGHSGRIGPGDVQWMTAGRGILHEEYHAADFAKTGGLFRVVQLWVNLPAKDKMAEAGYQTILAADIPVVELPDQAGSVRVIAGAFNGALGPAKTFTPVNVWDLTLARDAEITLAIPPEHSAILVGLEGHTKIAHDRSLTAAEAVLLSHEGNKVVMRAEDDAQILVLTGAPIHEPIVGHGPFVMNDQDEIRTAIHDFKTGQFGEMADS